MKKLFDETEPNFKDNDGNTDEGEWRASNRHVKAFKNTLSSGMFFSSKIVN